jgi:hypothetical protein
MRMRIKLVALSVVCLLSGCATAYQPDGASGGYSERRLNDNVEQVSFRGNMFSTPETLQSYLLRRCAEVTVQNGYNYFVVVNTGTPSEGSSVVIATIKMFKGRETASRGHAYDAAAVIKRTPV